MEEVFTRTKIIDKDSSGIITCTVIKNVYMNLEDGKENVEVFRKIGNGKLIPVLVDIRNSSGITKECRHYYASNESAMVMSAVALIVDSPLSRLIGNFMIGINKTVFPTKLFTDKNEAIKWLKSFL